MIIKALAIVGVLRAEEKNRRSIALESKEWYTRKAIVNHKKSRSK